MASSLTSISKRYQAILLCIIILLSGFSVYAKDTALIIRGQATDFKEIVKGIQDDVDDEISFIEFSIDQHSSANDIKQIFNRHSPRLIILIGNKAVNLYSTFQMKHPEMTFPPAIVMAALFIDEFAYKLSNFIAIRYEIPAVTSAVTVRNVLSQPVRKVGVIYRTWMKKLIEENIRYCQAEGIELVGIELPNKMTNVSEQIRSALNSLTKKVDAIWILNDNVLLTQETLANAWLPSQRTSKIPAIVGIKQFTTKIPLGSFAIVPDSYGLGAQAAGIMFDIIDNNWTLDHSEIRQPFSVNKFINTDRLKTKGIPYRIEMLNQVEVVKN